MCLLYVFNKYFILKFYGKDLNLDSIPGYNGIARNYEFTNMEPRNIKITASISKNSVFAEQFEIAVNAHKKQVNDSIIASNNQVWKKID